MTLNRLIRGLLLPALLLGTAMAPPADPAHRQEIEAWREARQQSLRSESGWLAMAGLFWLHQGENRFGTADDNDIIFPPGTAPAHAGALVLDGEAVTLTASPESGLVLDGRPVTAAPIRPDIPGKPDVLRLGDLSFYVIKRTGRLALRLRNPDNPARKHFRGIDYYPIDSGYRVQADFEPYDTPEKRSVPTVVGTPATMPAPGRVRFTLQGRELTLEPLLSTPEAERLFFILKDETSGLETYAAGRYLYSDLPENGKVVLDFNKAYNPPCVFTPYATCPLPLPQNTLAVAVRAGEKTYEVD